MDRCSLQSKAYLRDNTPVNDNSENWKNRGRNLKEERFKKLDTGKG